VGTKSAILCFLCILGGHKYTKMCKPRGRRGGYSYTVQQDWITAEPFPRRPCDRTVPVWRRPGYYLQAIACITRGVGRVSQIYALQKRTHVYNLHTAGTNCRRLRLPQTEPVIQQEHSSHSINAHLPTRHHSRYTRSSRLHRLAHGATAHRHTANSLDWPSHGHTTSETARSASSPAPPPTVDQTSRL
jgi:hypothetical protein